MDIDTQRAGELLHEAMRHVGHFLVGIGGKAMAMATANPGATTATGIGLSIVSVLQSAQDVMATLIALVTSLGGLFMAFVGTREAWRRWRKKDDAGK